jgi:dTDP-4-dehydrorhamnose 3,5-epimerase
MVFEIEVVEISEISGVKLIKFSHFRDVRGILFSFFDGSITNEILPKNLMFGHVKFALNNKKTLRGLHGDYKSWKLVTCVQGKIFQVAIDNRPDSPTFLHKKEIMLTGRRPQAVLLPPGVGNGFYSLTKSVYCYSLSYDGSYFDHDEQFTLKWNDPNLGINWPDGAPLLSQRDT